MAAMFKSPRGVIAVVLVQWSGVGAQSVAVPWRSVANAADAFALAAEIAAAPRLTNGGSTSISSAIDAGVALILSSPYRGSRATIDVSGDGDNNNGAPPDLSRDRAVALGLTVNGLAILNDVFYLDKYYENHVVGGPGHFVITTDDYLDFAGAIRLKLLREIVWPTS